MTNLKTPDHKTIQSQPFWEDIERFGAKPAITEKQNRLTYTALAERISERTHQILKATKSPRPLVLLKLTTSCESIINYLACLQGRAVACLLPHSLNPGLLAEYVRRFRPNVILSEAEIEPQHNAVIPMDESLALLMSTSGTTGAGQCVGLSYNNLSANTHAIQQFLPIHPNDNTLATLPLSYAYGLSVLNTHISAGANVICTAHTVFDKAFWTLIKETPIHSFAGVPSWYQMLLKLRFTRMALPDLHYFTQAGGALAAPDVQTLAQYCQETNKDFFIMYGQTEATARMAYLPPSQTLKSPNAIGQAIPGGEFRIRPTPEHAADSSTPASMSSAIIGELEYRGPNVMLGYANDHQDLTKFEKPTWLRTGDLAKCDEAGIYSIVGRIKRMIKINGERVNLDALERTLSENNRTVYCVGQDNVLHAFCAPEDTESVQTLLLEKLSIAQRNIKVIPCQHWPLLNNGKIDYGALASLGAQPTPDADAAQMDETPQHRSQHLTQH